jgi:hypothetical protein
MTKTDILVMLHTSAKFWWSVGNLQLIILYHNICNSPSNKSYIVSTKNCSNSFVATLIPSGKLFRLLFYLYGISLFKF